MNVTEVRELYAYNAWAQRRLFNALAQLPTEPYLRDLKSSHGGIHGTLCHIVWAEQLWLSRWVGSPKPAVAQGKELASLAAARARLGGGEAERGTFLDGVTYANHVATIQNQTTMGGAYVHTYLQTLQHGV